MLRVPLFNLCFLLNLTFSLWCNAEVINLKEKPSSKKLYYSSFAGYNIPLHLIEEISEDDALSRKDASYYIGFYNSKGQLYRVEKHLKGQILFEHNYSYHENGEIKKFE